MNRRNNDKDRLCSSPSKLDPIPSVLKMVQVTAKFLRKIHRKKVPVRQLIENQDDEQDTSPIKVDSIPLDLETEILTRLPAKSLMKFQCVSKMWSSVIRSQRFVDSYYAMSCTTPSHRFIIALSNGVFAKPEQGRLLIFSSSHEGDESSSLVTSLHMTIPSLTLDKSSDCVFVHGLLGCITNASVLVCNPSTGKVTILPSTGAFPSFGYDPVEAQFKELTMMPPYPYLEPDFLVHEVVTLGGGESSSWTRNKVTTPLYYTVTKTICINGFVYSGAWSPRNRKDPVIVCFDVRYERISFIKAPMSVVQCEGDSILIEYKGKLASIVRYPYGPFHSFDLWILEDVKKHDWSKQTFELPIPLGLDTTTTMTSPGINKAGEIIFTPTSLSRHVQPFYIFYYNVERKVIRRVRLLGIADNEEFRRRYGFAEDSYVHISPQHVESIGFL